MENIKFKEFIQVSPELEEKYLRVFKFMKGADSVKLNGRTYRSKPLIELTFNEVSLLKKKLADGQLPSIFQGTFGITPDQIMDIYVVEFFKGFNFIRDEMAGIAKMEEKLSGRPDPVLDEAGIEKMKIFKELNVLIPLARKYGIMTEDVAEWSYGKVFQELLYDKYSSEIEQEASKIRRKK
jgi:hypothetical protein